MNDNIMLLTDSYKHSHYKQYPPNSKFVYSYFESRRGAKFGTTVFFGLNYFLKKYLYGKNVVTLDKINEARELVDSHMGAGTFNYNDWLSILETHKGTLPVVIRAVDEGTVVQTDNVLMDIVNTDPRFPWLTNFLETILSNVWYPCTVATQSREMKRIIKSFFSKTSDQDNCDFQLHDFGCRGVTCPEQAAIGGAAHLVNFKGTDTIPAISLLRKYYNLDNVGMPGFSIPASEHSTITSWGSDHEVDAMRNMLEKYPTGLVACVSDSYDIYRACENIWGETLREQVLNRDGVLVIRPDSGNPCTVLPMLLKSLTNKFGATKNSKGYLVLNPKVRLIQGDGIDFSSLSEILEAVTNSGYSAENLAFGSGGGLLQKVNRDTQRFAFKCSSITVGDEERDVYKDPVTDNSKRSKRGRLKLTREFQSHGVCYKTEKDDGINNELKTVFCDGYITCNYKFDEIRTRASVNV